MVGNESGTFFWTDIWVGGVPLGAISSRMFELAESRWALVEDMS